MLFKSGPCFGLFLFFFLIFDFGITSSFSILASGTSNFYSSSSRSSFNFSCAFDTDGDDSIIGISSWDKLFALVYSMLSSASTSGAGLG